MTVERRNGKFLLISRTGKVLGSHKTRREAESQETAIKLSKLRRSGRHIPKK